jgi:hypothetical protein
MNGSVTGTGRVALSLTGPDAPALEAAGPHASNAHNHAHLIFFPPDRAAGVAPVALPRRVRNLPRTALLIHARPSRHNPLTGSFRQCDHKITIKHGNLDRGGPHARIASVPAGESTTLLARFGTSDLMTENPFSTMWTTALSTSPCWVWARVTSRRLPPVAVTMSDTVWSVWSARCVRATTVT